MIGEPYSYPNLPKNSWIIPNDGMTPWKEYPDKLPKFPHPWSPQDKFPVPVPEKKPSFPMTEEEIKKMEKLIKDSRDANEAMRKATEESDLKMLQELANKLGYKLIKVKPKKGKTSGN